MPIFTRRSGTAGRRSQWPAGQPDEAAARNFHDRDRQREDAGLVDHRSQLLHVEVEVLVELRARDREASPVEECGVEVADSHGHAVGGEQDVPAMEEGSGRRHEVQLNGPLLQPRSASRPGSGDDRRPPPCLDQRYHPYGRRRTARRCVDRGRVQSRADGRLVEFRGVALNHPQGPGRAFAEARPQAVAEDIRHEACLAVDDPQGPRHRTLCTHRTRRRALHRFG
jgi:hypothetical protein